MGPPGASGQGSGNFSQCTYKQVTTVGALASGGASVTVDAEELNVG